MNGDGADHECRVALLVTGNELIDGRCVDTNSPWVEARLREIGWSVTECRHVGDDPGAIRTALTDLAPRVPTILVSGGLGPTEDDRTREALAGWAEQPLVEDDAAWKVLQEKYAGWGRTPSPSNRRQAQRPKMARCLANPVGTAPGLTLPHGGTLVFALPGVPRELRDMVELHVVPELAQLAGDRTWCSHRFQVAGLAESAVGERLEPWMGEDACPQICLTAHVGTLTVTLWDLEQAGGRERLDARAAQVRQALGVHCFAEGEVGLAECVVERLRQQGSTVAVAESCTGGRVAAALTSVPGSSDVFVEGCVVYANEAKVRTLQVPVRTLETHGAVSEEVARSMAEGVRVRAGTTLAVSTTGVAGPAGGSADKPVGTVWLAVSDAHRTRAVMKHLTGDREQVQIRAMVAALDLLRRQLGEPSSPK